MDITVSHPGYLELEVERRSNVWTVTFWVGFKFLTRQLRKAVPPTIAETF